MEFCDKIGIVISQAYNWKRNVIFVRQKKMKFAVLLTILVHIRILISRIQIENKNIHEW